MTANTLRLRTHTVVVAVAADRPSRVSRDNGCSCQRTLFARTEIASLTQRLQRMKGGMLDLQNAGELHAVADESLYLRSKLLEIEETAKQESVDEAALLPLKRPLSIILAKRRTVEVLPQGALAFSKTVRVSQNTGDEFASPFRCRSERCNTNVGGRFSASSDDVGKRQGCTSSPAREMRNFSATNI